MGGLSCCSILAGDACAGIFESLFSGVVVNAASSLLSAVCEVRCVPCLLDSVISTRLGDLGFCGWHILKVVGLC